MGGGPKLRACEAFRGAKCRPSAAKWTFTAEEAEAGWAVPSVTADGVELASAVSLRWTEVGRIRCGLAAVAKPEIITHRAAGGWRRWTDRASIGFRLGRVERPAGRVPRRAAPVPP